MLYPEIVNIELTNACNLSCEFCDYVNLKKKMKVQNMPESVLLKILSELTDRKIYELGLVGLGEPLLNKYFKKNLEVIEGYKDSFQRISLNTNAVVLDHEKTRIIYKSPINFITISLNAGTQASYLKMMGKDHFHDVLNNISNFLKYGREHKLYPEIRIQLMQQDSHEFENILKIFGDILGENAKVFVRKEYNKPIYTAEQLSESDKRYPCWSIYSRVYIDVLGNIYPCTIGNDSYRESSNLCIGNIIQNSLLDIFNNQNISSARLNAEQGLLPFIECKECNIWKILPNNFKWENGKWELSQSDRRRTDLEN
ncbi:MAG: radical SAM protein [Bacteroidetes bacterium]|nr:radical SAM protein [Bacteroidota bacterium]